MRIVRLSTEQYFGELPSSAVAVQDADLCPSTQFAIGRESGSASPWLCDSASANALDELDKKRLAGFARCRDLSKDRAGVRRRREAERRLDGDGQTDSVENFRRCRASCRRPQNLTILGSYACTRFDRNELRRCQCNACTPSITSKQSKSNKLFLSKQAKLVIRNIRFLFKN